MIDYMYIVRLYLECAEMYQTNLPGNIPAMWVKQKKNIKFLLLLRLTAGVQRLFGPIWWTKTK